MSLLTARLERLPVGAFHRQLLVAGGLGYTFDAMDGAVLAFVLPVLHVAWSLSHAELGLLASASLIGFFFGAFLSGTLGDLIGRRAVMMSALVLYSATSAASAAVDDARLFFALRVLAGLGAGAESVIIAPYLSEFVSRRHRGAYTGALAGFFSFGFVAAALLGNFVVPHSPDGWRHAILITAAPVLLLLWWRRALPESPRWLESQGRLREAEAVVDRMEAAARAQGRALPPPDPADVAAAPAGGEPGSVRGRYAALLSPRHARVTLMSWAMWTSQTFAYYAFFTWIPSLLVERGMTLTRSFGYSLVIYAAQVPGYFTAAWLNERIGRRATIVGAMALGAGCALGMAMARTDPAIMLAGVLLSFFMNGAYAGLYAYTPELFPTPVRATAAGLASGIGRLGGIAAPILVGWVYPVHGFAGVFGMTTAVLLLGAAAVGLFGLPTRGRSLEAIAADVPGR